MKDLKKHVIDEFGTELTQEFYSQKAKEGFWKAEDISVRKYFKKKGSVLDIGCGTGRTTMPLFKMGYKVVGLDLTPNMIKSAKRIAKTKKLKIDYVVGDATDLRYDENSFDFALFSNNGWSQIPGSDNRLKALIEVNRVLKKDGIFIFTAHIRKGYFWLWVREWIKMFILKPFGFKIDEIEFGDRFFDRETGGHVYKQKQYIHIPTIAEVKELIGLAGFEILEMRQQHIIEKDDTKKLSPVFYVCRKV